VQSGPDCRSFFSAIMISITMSYHVHPPTGVILPKETPIFRSFDVQVNVTQDNRRAYYSALHEAIADAKDKLGVDLTIWRDVAGTFELIKEMKRAKKTDDADEEEEEGEGE